MRVCLITLGCARNLVDSEVMLGLLKRAKFKFSSVVEEANAVIINTCGFIKEARKETLAVIEDVFKRRSKNCKVIVVGCLVNKDLQFLQAQFPDVFYFLSAGNIDKIVDVLISKKVEERDLKSFLGNGDAIRCLSLPHYAYLKIAEGCNKRCSFCLIPTIKGPLRSKPIFQVVEEFKKLLRRGVFEIILIAQDLGDYGKDLGIQKGLTKLLKEIIKIKDNFWLRLLYLYPDEVDDALIGLISSDERICSYVDMPLQHIDDDILRAMGRMTSKERIIRTVYKLRKKNISIRTTFMVGFCGEKERQFRELLSFVREGVFDNIGIFKFSREKETLAYYMKHQISEKEKELRLRELAAAQYKVVEEKNLALVGKKMRVIVDGFHPDSKLLLSSRHQGQSPDIDGRIIINDFEKIKRFGALHYVRIQKALGYDLLGKII